MSITLTQIPPLPALPADAQAAELRGGAGTQLAQRQGTAKKGTAAPGTAGADREVSPRAHKNTHTHDRNGRVLALGRRPRSAQFCRWPCPVPANSAWAAAF